MDYDLGLLTGAEQKLFEKAGVTPPKAFATADRATYREFTLAGGEKIGVILFPDLPRKSKEPDQRTVKGIEDLVRKHRDEVRLLIGISPWGLWVEQAFMKMKPVGPHIVLGSGIGTELRGVLRDSKGRIFWSRSSVRGRSVARIDVLQWPEGDDFIWTDNGSIKSDFISLTDQHPENGEVLQIILGE